MRHRSAYFDAVRGVAILVFLTLLGCAGGKSDKPEDGAITADKDPAKVSVPAGTDPDFKVKNTYPQNNQENIPPASSILIHFSKAVNRDSLKDGFQLAASGGGTGVAFSVAPFVGPEGEVASAALITPTEALAPETTFTASVSTQVKSSEGNQLSAAYQWNFKTGAAVVAEKPEVYATVPASGANSTDTNFLIVTFSEAVDVAHFKSTSGQFTLTPAATLHGEITAADQNRTLYMAFQPRLKASTSYTAKIKKEAVKDTSGNLMEADYSWSFTTKPCGAGKGQTPCGEDCGPGKGQTPCSEGGGGGSSGKGQTPSSE